MKENELACSGTGCRFKLVCDRYIKWMTSDDDDIAALIPLYDKGDCPNLIRSRFYGE